MEEEHFDGLMTAGMKDNLEMVSKVGMEFYTVKEDIHNIKVHGIMECLMEKEFNFSKMAKNMKVFQIR